MHLRVFHSIHLIVRHDCVRTLKILEIVFKSIEKEIGKWGGYQSGRGVEEIHGEARRNFDSKKIILPDFAAFGDFWPQGFLPWSDIQIWRETGSLGREKQTTQLHYCRRWRKPIDKNIRWCQNSKSSSISQFVFAFHVICIYSAETNQNLGLLRNGFDHIVHLSQARRHKR